jgi:hypothetical protein
VNEEVLALWGAVVPRNKILLIVNSVEVGTRCILVFYALKAYGLWFLKIYVGK